MTNRIGTAFAAQQAVQALNRQDQTAARLQQQIASGQRMTTAADDPVGAAEAERLRAANARSAIDRRMMDFAQSSLSRADSVLSTGTSTLQSVRDLLISAGNGSYTPSELEHIGTQIKGLRDELFSLANQDDGAGGFVFGGQGSTRAPFGPPASPAFQGGAGTQQTGMGMAFDLTVDGSRVFLGDGSTNATGSIFAALDKAVAQLQDGTLPRATVSAGVTDAMDAVDQTLDRMMSTRTSVGEQMRAIDSRTRMLESGELVNTTRSSAITDTDYAQALSQVSQNQMASQAAMRAYAQISHLSLFDYL